MWTVVIANGGPAKSQRVWLFYVQEECVCVCVLCLTEQKVPLLFSQRTNQPHCSCAVSAHWWQHVTYPHTHLTMAQNTWNTWNSAHVQTRAHWPLTSLTRGPPGRVQLVSLEHLPPISSQSTTHTHTLTNSMVIHSVIVLFHVFLISWWKEVLYWIINTYL